MLLRHTSLYLLASAVSGVFGLLSTTVFTRLLPPNEYGVYIVGVGAAGVVASVLFTWVRYAAMRFQSEGGDVDVRRTTLAAYLLSAAAAPLIALVLFFAFGLSFEQAIFAALMALGVGLFELGQELLKARLQTRSYAIAVVIRCIAAFVLCLAAARIFGTGIAQIAMAGAAYFLAAALIARSVWRAPLAPVAWNRLYGFLSLGVPLTLSGFLFAFHSALDRLMVAWILGDSAAGVYGASADFVRQMILVPTGSAVAAAVPLAVRALAQGGAEEAAKQLKSGAELLLAILVPAVFGLALVNPYLVAIVMGQAFRSTATTIIPILCFAWLFQSITQSYVHLSFHLAKRPALGTAQTLATLVVNVASLWPLTKAFGLPGAAVSLLLAESAGAAVGFSLSRYAYPLPSIWGPLLRVGAATGVMALILAEIEAWLPDKTAAVLAILILTGVVAYALAALAFDIADCRTMLFAALQDRFGAETNRRSAGARKDEPWFERR